MGETRDSFTAGEGRLFPDFVCRIAGLPAGLLGEGLRLAAWPVVRRELVQLEEMLAAEQERLGEALFAAIGAASDAGLRRRLVGLRRDLHNLRSPSANELAALAPHLPPALAASLVQFQALLARQGELLKELALTYERELPAVRARLQQAVGNADFQRGLLLSSQALSAGLERYAATPPDRLGSKERQIERGLLRYFSRMVMKTSPFSTFCALAAGEFAEDDGISRGDPQSKTSRLRLNKGLYAHLLPQLLARPAIRHQLRIELNPTLDREADGRWVFLTAAASREIFRRLAPTPILALLHRILSEAPPPRLAELLHQLATHPEIEATADEVETFVDRLASLGFLRFRLGIPEQEVDWDRPLRALLEGIDDAQAAEATRLLADLRRDLEAYADAEPIAGRRERLASARQRIAAVFPAFAKDSVRQPELPFYEDAGSSACLHLPATIQESLGKLLSDYVRLTSRLAWPRGEQATARHFFASYYGSDASPVPLLRFYEDFYREHFKGHLERLARPAAASPAHDLGNPFALPFVTALHRAFQELKDCLARRWREAPQAAVLDLSHEELAAIVAAVPPAGTPPRSLSIFGQLLPGMDGAPPGLVANAYLVGYGKYFSRFLYLLPPAVEARLYANNLGLSRDIGAEICGDGSFNANLHPPLLRWEIGYPTGERGHAEETLPTRDLYVEADPRDPHALALRHGPSGQRVVPVDLGFLNPQMRPPLYQLLSRLTPASNFAVPIPDAPQVLEGDGTRPAVLHRPRITFGGRLVLARRSWQVASEAFPVHAAGTSDAEHFLAVDRWRRRQGLPEEVFVHVRALAPAAEDGALPAALRGHLHKPQYVDFRNPLLVHLLGRLPGNLRHFTATFSERLPAAEHLLAWGNDAYVTELALQLDFPEETA